MKKHFFKSKRLALLSVLLGLGGVIFGINMPVDLQVGYLDPVPPTNGHGKAPIRIPSLWQDDNMLTFESSHADFTLTLIDEDGFTVYTTQVPADVDVVVLPSTLYGSYELRLETDTYYYIGYINL